MGHDAAAVKVVARMFGLKFDTLWQRYEREKKRWRIIWTSAISLAALVAIGVAAVITRQYVLLRESNLRIMKNESKFIAEKSIALAKAGDSYSATRLALYALPENLLKPGRPYTAEAEVALRQAVRKKDAIIQDFSSEIECVAFSPDGKKLAACDANGTARVWNTYNGKLLWWFENTEDPYEHPRGDYRESLAFRPDGKAIAFCDWLNHAVDLWEIEPDAVLNGTLRLSSLSCCVAFSPEGDKIATGSFDGEILIWNPTTHDVLFSSSANGHSDEIESLSFSSDGKLLASASQDGTVRIWDLEAGTELCIIKGEDYEERLLTAAFSPDSKTVACGSNIATIRLWDIASRKTKKILKGHTAFIESVAFSPDGKTLVSGSSDKTVRQWDAETGELIHTYIGHTAGVTSVAFSPDGRILVSGSEDTTIRIWDTAPDPECEVIWEGDGLLRSIAYSPDRVWMASCSDDSGIQLYDHSSGTRRTIPREQADTVYSLSFSPDGELLASGSRDGHVRIWDVGSLQIIADVPAHSSWVNSVAFSPDGKRLVSGSHDGWARIWDTGSGKMIAGRQFFEENTREVRVESVAFSPDGKQIAVGGYNDLVLWKPGLSDIRLKLAGHTEAVTQVVFSPDGRTLATAAYDDTVRIWDYRSRKSLHVLAGHSDIIMGLAYSPDGTKLVTGSLDGTIRIWDVDSGKQMSLYEIKSQAMFVMWRDYAVTCVTFSADGQYIASGFNDCTLRIWTYPPLQELIDTHLPLLDDNPISLQEWERFGLD